jgi:serine/threonine protein kinase
MASDDESRLEEVVAAYIDRLSAGETIDPVIILAEHPEIAGEVIEQLHVYLDLAGGDGQKQAPGALGDYTLRRQIGRGGMGVVYEAWENSMQRRVALKVLPSGIAADARATARFIREAQAAGRLAHESIVRVHAMGVYENTPYYSMEYVEGDTLARIVAKVKEAEPGAETPFGPKDQGDYFARLARSFADVADGLQHAHSRGVIHRDIKPSNLILDAEADRGDGGPPGGRARAKDRLRILDFGLARLQGQESLTISGDFVGTPLYMSPEQARRKKVSVDHRTDVYSLGATMYEVLTGRPPFQGKDHQETLSQIVEKDPVDPSRLNPRLPKALETIVLKCLRKDPADRYGTAEALAQDLRRFVRRDPIEAKAQTRWERISRRLRRHRISLLAAGAFLVLLAFVGWFAYRGQQADREARLASYRPALLEVLRRVQAEQLSVEALSGGPTEVTWFFGRALGLIDRDELRAVISARTRPPLEKAAAQLAAVAEAVPERPDAFYHLAKSYWLLDRKAEAKEALGKALRCDPGFVPGEVLSLEIEGEKIDGDRFARICSLGPDPEGWKQWWLSAQSHSREQLWNEVALAWSKLIAVSQQAEPYVGCLFEAFLQRGLARLKLGDYLAAIEDLSVVCSHTPGLEPRLLLAKAHLRTRTPAHAEQAEAILRELYEQAPDDEKDEVALWISLVFGSVEKYDECIAWARRIQRLPLKERFEAYFLRRAGRTPEAILAGREAVLRNPTDPLARLTLASVLLSDLLARPGGDAGRLSELLDAAREALRLDPRRVQARRLIEAAEDIQRDMEGERQGSAAPLEKTVLVPVGSPRPGRAGGEKESIVRGFFDDVKKLPRHLHAPAECSPSVTQDGLELYFARPVSEILWVIHVARRATPDDPWGPAERLAELDQMGGCEEPCVMPDGKALYFSNGSTARPSIFLVERQERGAPYPAPRKPFGKPVRLQEIRGISPSLTADGRELYYADNATGRMDAWDVHVAWRSDPAGPFDRMRRLDEINSDRLEGYPCISADGLTLFWSEEGDYEPETVKPGCHGLGDIWYATRERRWDDAGESAPFGPPTCLPRPVNGPINDLSPCLSWDWPGPGAKLYFARYGPGGDEYAELWEATWRLDRNGDGVDDLEGTPPAENVGN